MRKFYIGFIFCFCLLSFFAQKRSTVLTPNFIGKSKKEMFEIYDKLNGEITAHPNSHSTLFTRSFLKYSLGDTLGAIDDIEKALLLDPGNSGYHYLHSYEIIDLHRYEEVIEECEILVKTQKNADVFILLGHALDFTDKHEQARALYQKALAIDSLYDDAYIRYAVSFALVNDYNEALVWINKLLQKLPDSEDGLKMLTTSQLILKNYEEVIKGADRMIAAKKLRGEAFEMKAIAYDSLKNQKEACSCMLKSFLITQYVDQFEYIQAKCPEEQKNKSVMLLKLQFEGQRYKDMGDFKTAYDFFDKAVTLAPDSASSYYNRGKAKRNLEDHKGAIEDYQIALKKNPRMSIAYVGLGVSYTFLGQVSEAKKTYVKCMAVDPFCDMAFYNFGDLLRNEDNYKEAIYYFNYAAMINPYYTKAFYWLGECYVKTGAILEACAAFKRAEKLGDTRAKTQRIWYCR